MQKTKTFAVLSIAKFVLVILHFAFKQLTLLVRIFEGLFNDYVTILWVFGVVDFVTLLCYATLRKNCIGVVCGF